MGGEPAGARISEEHRYLAAYRSQYQALPYPPVFVTVDILVRWRGMVLLIRRGGQPGRGTWALPGGFLDAGERLASAAIREAKEETGLDIPVEAMGDPVVFDAPGRSLRGRTITHVFPVSLPDDAQPAVRAGDDAADARWFDAGTLVSASPGMFDDHWHICRRMLGMIQS